MKRSIWFIQVAVITLNNPSKLNALTEDMGNELTARVRELLQKKELRAAILTGGNALIPRPPVFISLNFELLFNS